MGLVDDIARARGLSVKRAGGLSLIASRDAEAFLNECQLQRVRVIGAEGVRLEGTATVPDMGAIADFSELALEPAVKSVREAKRFVREITSPALLLDFTLERESEVSG